jgi:(2Fe-2S) ferredoxin
MWRKRIHFLVCRNERPPGPITCCARGLGEQVLKRLIVRIGESGLYDEVLATGTDCLGPCRPEGVTVIAYPEGAWYRLERPEDADLLLDAFEAGGGRPEALDRMRLDTRRDFDP